MKLGTVKRTKVWRAERYLTRKKVAADRGAAHKEKRLLDTQLYRIAMSEKISASLCTGSTQSHPPPRPSKDHTRTEAVFSSNTVVSKWFIPNFPAWRTEVSILSTDTGTISRRHQDGSRLLKQQVVGKTGSSQFFYRSGRGSNHSLHQH